MSPKATYDSSIPVSGSGFSSHNIRNVLNGIAQGDSEPLRPRAQDTPDMTVRIGDASVESYYHQVYNDRSAPLEYSEGNSPEVVAPDSNPRIDVLMISGSTTGTLHWVIGAEGAVPTMPLIPSGTQTPVCAIYCNTTMDRILNYEVKDTDATEGYLYKDLRPKIVRLSDEKLGVYDPGVPWAGDTAYQATEDGLVTGYLACSSTQYAYCDSDNPPVTARQQYNISGTSVNTYFPVCFPVKKNDYWKVTGSPTLFFMPLTS